MGNNQAIEIDEVKAKFATCEVEEIEKEFQRLAKEGSFRGKSFDKKTFVRLCYPHAPDLGSSIFDVMDRSKDGKVTEDEFLLALSIIIRGSTKEKFRYIFMMISFTCGTGQQRVSPAELMKFLSFPFFQPKSINRKLFEQKVKENVVEYFRLYDKDKDKFLNLNEFFDFAENSFEITLILEIFLNISKKFTASSVISGPTGVVHETHVARTEGGGISIDNIPKDWLQLIRDAGIKKKELENPQTAMMLMEIIAKKIGEKTNQSTSTSSSTSPPPSTSSFDDTSSPIAFNQSIAPSIAPAAVNHQSIAPSAPSPPPPPPSFHSPPPPPPPSLSSSLPQTAGGSGVEGTQTAMEGGRGGLLSQIKQGTKLKPVEMEVEKLTKEDRNDITSALIEAMRHHRVSMNEDDDDDDNNDDWD